MMKGHLRCDIRDYPLSFCEWGVLICVALGYTNRQIGENMFIVEQTVKNHISTIMLKFGANNRAHCVAIGFSLGYLS
jgi:DNA-binding NarL/FixJ family response regulator